MFLITITISQNRYNESAIQFMIVQIWRTFKGEFSNWARQFVVSHRCTGSVDIARMDRVPILLDRNSSDLHAWSIVDSNSGQFKLEKNRNYPLVSQLGIAKLRCFSCMQFGHRDFNIFDLQVKIDFSKLLSKTDVFRPFITVVWQNYSISVLTYLV